MPATTLSRTAVETYATNVVRELNLGRCALTGAAAPKGVGNWCHRAAEGRGGPKIPSNGLWLHASVHAATHSAAALSRACGWMVDTPGNSTRWTLDQWGAYLRRIPVLCQCQGISAWWSLDDSGDGVARLAEDAEVEAAGLDPARTLPEALAELERVTGWRAA